MKQFIEVEATEFTGNELTDRTSTKQPERFFLNVSEIKIIRQGVIYTYSEPLKYDNRKFKNIHPVSRNYETDLGLK